ncbi:MAG: glycoside hydrolase family 3 N-terminal domain-containing protein [Solirubrobacteraceae bacterium]
MAPSPRPSLRTAARRRRVLLLAAACAAAALGAIVGSGGGDDGGDARERGGRAPAADADRRGERPVKRTQRVDRLTLSEQVGQTIAFSYDGATVPDYVRRILREGRGGGVVLFRDNVVDPEQLRGATRILQRAAGGSALVMADQEGGEVRIVPFAPPESGQAGQSDPATARAAARGAARELRRLGVNVNLAPVVDVASEGSALGGRTFPGDPSEVAAIAAASVRGYAATGVAATVKHFPGFGAATENTDDAPVTIDRDRATLERADLEPFAAAVRAGTPLVMVSHAVYPALDPERIASQSRAVVEGLLRGRLRFRGVVITDSIEAEAVTSRSDVATAALRSIRAGVDVVLSTGPGSYRDIYDALLAESRRSPSFRRRVREAAVRVLVLKRRMGLRAPS